MESIGDYIYIIVIAIAIISSIARKGKKKEEQQKTMPDNMPDLEDVLTDTYAPFNKTEVVNKDFADYNKSQTVLSYDTVDDVSVLRAKKQVKSKKAFVKENTEPILSAENIETMIDLSEIEEVKKAIIYSEVFNRKY